MKNLKKVLALILVMVFVMADFAFAQEMIVADVHDHSHEAELTVEETADEAESAVFEPAAGEVPADEPLQIVLQEVFVQDMPAFEVPAQAEADEDEQPSEEVPADAEIPAEEEAPAEEVPVETPAKEEIPSEETSAEKESVEEEAPAEVPSEDVPADENTAEGEAAAEEDVPEVEIIEEVVLENLAADGTVYCTACGADFEVDYYEENDDCETHTAVCVHGNYGPTTGHNYINLDYDNDYHWQECADCYFMMEEGHFYNCIDGKEGVCDICGVVNGKNAPNGYPYTVEIGHEVDWSEYQTDAKSHWFYCTVCEKKLEFEDHYVDCYYDPDHCAVCDMPASNSMEYYHSYSYDPDDYTYTENYHETTCEGCGAASGRVPHYAYCDGDLTVCFECGAEDVHVVTEHNVDYETYYSDGSGHWNQCESCGAKVDKSVHWAYCDAPKTCAVCGKTSKTAYEIMHDYDYVNTVNRTGSTHDYQCLLCGNTRTSPHYVSCSSDDNTCIVCGTVCESASVRHNTKYEIFEDYCREVCKDCGRTLYGSKHMVDCAAPYECINCGKTDLTEGNYDYNHAWLYAKKDKYIHTVSCANCDFSETEYHYAYCENPKICLGCGYSGTMDLVHNIEDPAFDDEQHWYQCYSCYARVYESKHWAWCDGTGVCGECGYDGDVDIYHEYDENNICIICGNGRPAIAAISMPSEITIGVGEKIPFVFELEPHDGVGYLTLRVNNYSESEIIKIDLEKGKIIGAKRGSAQIIITDENTGKSASCLVKVIKAPKKLTITPSKLVLGLGDSYTLKSSITDGTASNISWSSSSRNAIVDSNGVVTASALGKATITGKTFNKKTDTTAVTVVGKPDTVILEAEHAYPSVGMNMDLKVTMKSGGIKMDGTYYYSCQPAGSVSFEGNSMTLLQPGEVTITATSYNGRKGSVTMNVAEAPDQLYLDNKGTAYSTITLGIGEKQIFNPVIANLSPAEVEYIYPEGVSAAIASIKGDALITGDGEEITVTGKAKGNTSIIVQPSAGGSARIDVNVLKAPSKVTLSSKKLSMGENGDTARLYASLPAGSSSRLTWKSSDTGVVEVDQEGNLKAKAKGKATITVSTFNKKKASCTVTVKPGPEYIETKLSRNTISIGMTTTLDIALNKGAAGSYTYYAEPADCVQFSGDKLIALKEGYVAINARAYNGAANLEPCVLNIQPEPDYVILNDAGHTRISITLGKGEKYTIHPAIFNGSEADYTFNNNTVADGTKIASVSDEGVIKANKAGYTEISVIPHRGGIGYVDVNVVAAPKSVKLSKTKLTLGVGDTTQQLTAILSKGSSSKLKWKSSKTSVVEVDQEGRLKAKATGSATITVSTFNDKKATCKVTVKKEPEYADIVLSADTISIGQTADIGLELSPGSAASYNGYACYPEGIVEINSGVVTPVGVGMVEISTRLYNGMPLTTSLLVKPEPDALMIEPDDTIVLGVGEKFTLGYRIANGSPADVTYKVIEGSKKASVGETSGKITAKAKGVAVIEATPHAGTSDTIKVYVLPAPKSIKLSAKKMNMEVGETRTLVATIPDETASKITWSSSNRDAVQVDEYGQIKAVGNGVATITVKTFNGKTAKCSVTVGDMLELSPWVFEPLKEAARAIGLTKYQKVSNSEVPYQYYNSNLLIAAYSCVEHISLKGGAYQLYGGKIGMDALEAIESMEACGLVYRDEYSDWGSVLVFERPADEKSPDFIDEYDSCVNVWIKNDTVYEMDWNAYTG